MAVYKEIEDFTDNKYYLYRHIRLDKNNVFYVGIGTKCGWNKSIEKRYMRAFSQKNRNRIWKSIASHGYDVEVFYTSDSLPEIKKKEQEFIKLYGRIDLKTGTLSNMTDGGELNNNVSPCVWEKRKQSYIASGNYQKMIDRFKTTHRTTKERFYGINSPMRVDIYVYNLSGEKIKHFVTKTECSKTLGIAQSTIFNYRDRPTNIYGYILRSTDCGDKIDTSGFIINTNRKKGNQNARGRAYHVNNDN